MRPTQEGPRQRGGTRVPKEGGPDAGDGRLSGPRGERARTSAWVLGKCIFQTVTMGQIPGGRRRRRRHHAAGGRPFGSVAAASCPSFQEEGRVGPRQRRRAGDERTDQAWALPPASQDGPEIQEGPGRPALSQVQHEVVGLQAAARRHQRRQRPGAGPPTGTSARGQSKRCGREPGDEGGRSWALGCD